MSDKKSIITSVFSLIVSILRLTQSPTVFPFPSGNFSAPIKADPFDPKSKFKFDKSMQKQNLTVVINELWGARKEFYPLSRQRAISVF